MAFVAMEPPTALEPRAISEEKNKVSAPLPIDPQQVVRGQFTGYRSEEARSRTRHRDVHRAQVRPGQLALGRRPVLPAHRQTDGRGCADHLDRLQGGPAACSPPTPGSAWPTGHPHLRPRRRVEGVAVVLRQAAWPGMRLEKLSMQFSHQETNPCRRRARGLRAADPRRDARRPRCSPPPTASRASGSARRPCWRTRPSPSPTRRATGAQRHPPARRAARPAAAVRAGPARPHAVVRGRPRGRRLPRRLGRRALAGRRSRAGRARGPRVRCPRPGGDAGAHGHRRPPGGGGGHPDRPARRRAPRGRPARGRHRRDAPRRCSRPWCARRTRRRTTPPRGRWPSSAPAGRRRPGVRARPEDPRGRRLAQAPAAEPGRRGPPGGVLRRPERRGTDPSRQEDARRDDCPPSDA